MQFAQIPTRKKKIEEFSFFYFIAHELFSVHNLMYLRRGKKQRTAGFTYTLLYNI